MLDIVGVGDFLGDWLAPDEAVTGNRLAGAPVTEAAAHRQPDFK